MFKKIKLVSKVFKLAGEIQEIAQKHKDKIAQIMELIDKIKAIIPEIGEIIEDIKGIIKNVSN